MSVYVPMKLNQEETRMLDEIVASDVTGAESRADVFRLLLHREYRRRHGLPKPEPIDWQGVYRPRGRPKEKLPGAEIARRLSLRWDGEQDWEGQGKLWVFSDANPRSPSFGMTFYLAPGSTLKQVTARLEEKRQEYLPENVAA